MRLLAWLIRGFIFLALFAFALNNQHVIAVRGFFGLQWEAPLVFALLAAFALGAALGVLAMLPSWWRARGTSNPRPAVPLDSQAPSAAAEGFASAPARAAADAPPRVGL
jgi:uncharacterized integral membrane protein